MLMFSMRLETSLEAYIKYLIFGTNIVRSPNKTVSAIMIKCSKVYIWYIVIILPLIMW
ncbi:MAG: hypothetical protein K0R15_2877 [Clostridiales bacterium]|jgi:hypothetical protein|nr:hypothetical protein [Clostridiales bacterium]